MSDILCRIYKILSYFWKNTSIENPDIPNITDDSEFWELLVRTLLVLLDLGHFESLIYIRKYYITNKHVYFIYHKHLSGKETRWRLIVGDSVNSLCFFASGSLRYSLVGTVSLYRKGILGMVTGLRCSWGGEQQMVRGEYQESKSYSECWITLNLTFFGVQVSFTWKHIFLTTRTSKHERVTHHNPLFFLGKIKIKKGKHAL